jgi:NAD-dependent dihydropyrimidine dehydrogenase PreA subunit
MPDGKKIAMVIEEAGEICHTCMACRDACPEEAINVIREEE